MKKCSKCQTFIEDDSIFCPSCGAKYEPKKVEWFKLTSSIYGIVFSIIAICTIFFGWGNKYIYQETGILNGGIIDFLKYIMSHTIDTTFASGFILIYLFGLIILCASAFTSLIMSIISTVDKAKIKLHYIFLGVLFLVIYLLGDFFGASTTSFALLSSFISIYLIIAIVAYVMSRVKLDKPFHIIVQALMLIGLYFSILSLLGVEFYGYVPGEDYYVTSSGILGFLLFLFNNPASLAILLILYLGIYGLMIATIIMMLKKNFLLSAIFDFVIAFLTMLMVIVGVSLGQNSLYLSIPLILFTLFAGSFTLIHHMKLSKQ